MLNRLFDLARRLILSAPVLANLIAVALVLAALALLPDAGLPS